jgi:hypothetical protein
MKLAAAIFSFLVLILLNACATSAQPAAGGGTTQSPDGFRYPYNSLYW